MPWDPYQPGETVCVCHRVGHNQCRDLVLAGRVKTLTELEFITPAGSNCSLCEPYFEKIITMYLAVPAPAAPASTPPSPAPSAGCPPTPR
jgi:bacterioferritin-associated ferredoxin